MGCNTDSPAAPAIDVAEADDNDIPLELWEAADTAVPELWAPGAEIAAWAPAVVGGWKEKPEDQWSCKRSPESAAYTNKHV